MVEQSSHYRKFEGLNIALTATQDISFGNIMLSLFYHSPNKSLSIFSRVVELLSHYPKFEGSNPATLNICSGYAVPSLFSRFFESTL